MNAIPKANKIKIIITFAAVALVIILMIIFRHYLFGINTNITDGEKFFKEYNDVPVDNVYKYVTIEQAIELFKSDEAIIFFGFKECIWCQKYAPILNQYAKENNVDVIYYCDIKQDRANNTKQYQQLVHLLSSYLEQDKYGNKRIYVPDVYFVKDGNIIGHNNDTSTQEGGDIKEYYDQYGEELNRKINELFGKIKKVCDDSAQGC